MKDLINSEDELYFLHSQV